MSHGALGAQGALCAQGALGALGAQRALGAQGGLLMGFGWWWCGQGAASVRDVGPRGLPPQPCGPAMPAEHKASACLPAEQEYLYNQREF